MVLKIILATRLIAVAHAVAGKPGVGGFVKFVDMVMMSMAMLSVAVAVAVGVAVLVKKPKNHANMLKRTRSV